MPNIHNLVLLYDKITPFINFSINKSKLKKHNQVYLETAYANEIGTLPTRMPSYEEAVSFYEFAKKIYEKTLNLLEK